MCVCVPIQESSFLVDSYLGRTYFVRDGMVGWKELLKNRFQESCVHKHTHTQTGLLCIYVHLLIQWRHVDRHLYCYWSMLSYLSVLIVIFIILRICFLVDCSMSSWIWHSPEVCWKKKERSCNQRSQRHHWHHINPWYSIWIQCWNNF